MSGERSWTYAALASEAQARAGSWRAAGLQRGQRVFITPGDRVEYIVSVLACALGGFDIVSVSQKATPVEVDHIRRVSRPDLEWSGPAAAMPDAREHGDFHDVRVFFFTSGTTSLPKGVCHRFETLVANAQAFNDCAGLDDSVVMMHVMPTGYMAGLLNTFISPFIAGGTAILGDAFDAKMALGFWALAQQHSVNALWLTPTMAAALTPLGRGGVADWARARLRHVFVGTAPLHAATRTAFRDRFGVDCLESYGMTECMYVSVNHPDRPNPGTSVGWLLNGVDAHTRAGDTVLPAGSEGDLWLKSSYMSLGYLDDATGEPITPAGDGWLDTGDVAVFDSGGRMTITGRRKDLIIRGGTNVSPKAVEDVLLEFPGVREAAVVGTPHPFWGEQVVACLIPSPGATIDVAGVPDFCATRLTADAVPSRCVVLDEFPRATNGKIQKHLLRQQVAG